MGFGFGSPFGEPLYEGGGTSTVAPYVMPVALGGHGYMLDWTADPPLDFSSVQLTKPQQDTGDAPGEQSINPEAFWRRLRESWHLGAGQRDVDREESSPFRFGASKGVNVWERNQACLHHDTALKVLSGNTNQRAIVVGGRLYHLNGTALGYFTSLAGSITAVTSMPGTAATDIATDGFNIITAHGASGVYKTTRTTGAAASHITGTVSVLGFVRGRFLAAHNNNIYDITALTVGVAGALPTALFTQSNTDFDFVAFAEGSGWIYAAGYSGDKSLIYKTQVREDGAALDQFSVAAELPDGEIVRSIYGYLGRFICIGTDKGFRLAAVDGSGDLAVGVLIETPAPVLCFEGQDRFIWYGGGALSTSAPTYTGLGRFSTSDFVNIELLQPAWATDLIVAGQVNNITSVVTFEDKRVFTVDGIGLWHEADTLVSEGYIDTGRVTYGTNEDKVGLFFNIQHTGTQGEIEVFGAYNDGNFLSIGARDASTQPMEKLNIGEVSGTSFEFRIMLKRSTVDTTQGPCLLSWLMRAEPKSEVTYMILASVILAPTLLDLTGQDSTQDAYGELDFIEELHRTKRITTWEQSGRAYSVIVEDFQVGFKHLIQDNNGNGHSHNSTATLKMKRL